MKLTNEQIKTLLTGAVHTEEVDGALCPYRFTAEQIELYANHRPRFGKRPMSTAGIRLCFKTDSENLFLKMNFSTGASRRYYSVDVFVDGKLLDYMDNFSDQELPELYTTGEFPLGINSKNFDLGSGTKTVTVYFPWSCSTEILEMSLDDGASFEPVKRAKKLLAFGDSITQGYDALRPSNRYASKLADLLEADETNKGVGGEIFVPDLAELREDFEPDYITVAYGTNDWGKSDAPEVLPKNCKQFYETVSRLYPKAQIFAITPIWRGDYATKEVAFGPFEKVAALIREVAEPLPNVTVIDGFSFVPGDSKYFADLRLHPNDEGFEHYAKNLYEAIREHLK